MDKQSGCFLALPIFKSIHLTFFVSCSLFLSNSSSVGGEHIESSLLSTLLSFLFFPMNRKGLAGFDILYKEDGGSGVLNGQISFAAPFM